MVYFTVSVLILAAMLFFPVSKMVWVVSVRRLEKKLQKTLTDEERRGQLNRARIITIPVVLTFAWLFCFNMGFYPAGG